VRCRAFEVPVSHLELRAISVRGELGPLSVYSTWGGHSGKHERPGEWSLVGEATLAPSPHQLQPIALDVPLRMRPGETVGIYVHSRLVRDTAIVYADQRCAVTHEDRRLQILPGLAHLSHVPFCSDGLPGAPLLHPQGWRQGREFVGRIAYSVKYFLWRPSCRIHRLFPWKFRRTVVTLLMAQRRPGSPLCLVPAEALFYVLNLCRWDCFDEV